MDVDEIADVIGAGMCRGDKVAECSTCQRKLRAIEAVRAMGAVCEAARTACDEMPCTCFGGTRCAGHRLLDAIDTLAAVEADHG